MPLFGEPGQRIAYERYPHPAGGPPLYLVHGFTASAASFAANLAALREHFTVVTVELLGHGDSEAPGDPALYSPAATVERILGLMDELGDEDVFLCGHSLGGAVAVQCALVAPERFAGIVVINSASAAGTPAWAEGVQAGMAELAAKVRAEGTGFLKRTRLYPAHSRRLDERSRELLTRDFDRLQPAGLVGTAEGLIPYVNAFERLPELQVPMLVVAGQRDRDFMDVLPGFLAQLPHGMARVIGLPEAGHAANIEQPREFEAAVIDFAREVGYLRPPVAPPARGGTNSLHVIGGVFVAAGLGMLTAALVVANLGGNGGGTYVAAEPATTPTPGFTPVEEVAGTRTPISLPAGGVSTPVAAETPAAPATPTATPTPTPTPRPGAAVPTPTPEVPPPLETPTPAPTPTPTATPTPEGAHAAISGPTRVAVGESATFFDASQPTPLRVTWRTPSGTFTRVGGVTVSFPTEGCYEITLEGIFPDGPTRTAVLTVAVGEATCGE